MALTNKPADLTGAIVGTIVADDTDILFGTSGNDVISGGLAATLLTDGVSDGIDTMEGGAGDDIYIVKDANDIIIEVAQQGNDTVWSTATYNLSTKAAEVENIGALGAANTTLFGNAKDNILDGSQDSGDGIATGLNILAGGAGNDTYFLGLGDKVTESAAVGIDNVYADFTVDLTNATTTGIASAGTAAQMAATVANIENVFLTGSAAANITGNGLNNFLVGNSGSNLIKGGAGLDTLDTGTGGADTLDGGLGNDTYIVRSGVTATFSAIGETALGGIDLVQSFATVNTTGAFIENITLKGTAAINATGNTLANVLTGNSADNTLLGGAGNDTLNAGAGTNTLDGGTGADVYNVVSATDSLAETLVSVAATERDTVNFNGTAGTLVIGANIEAINLLGTANIGATVAGTSAAHTMTGNIGNNALTGGNGIDSISGGDGDDALVGNAGNDTLNAGIGSNTLDGGAGADVYNVVSATDTLAETLVSIAATERDTVNFSGTTGTLAIGDNIEVINLLGIDNIGASVAGTAAAHTMTGNAGNNALTGGSGIDNINGNDGNDFLIGNSGNDSLTGGNGNDTIEGGVGNDALIAGAGANILDGGAGVDIYTIVSASDTITELTVSTLATERDIVNFSGTTGTLVIGDNIEVINLTGTNIGASVVGTLAAHTMTGSTGNNILIGGNGADTINGGVGLDSMTGGDGSDIFTVDNVGDTVIEAVLDGDTDVVNVTFTTVGATFNMSTTAAGVETLNLGGAAAINGTGNNQNNTINGNTAINTIIGNDGNDTINAGAGNDIIDGGIGDDLITGGVGRDVVNGGAGADTFKFAAGVTDTVATASSVAGIDLYSSVSWVGATGDKIDLIPGVANVNGNVSGTVSTATFIANMNTLLSVGVGNGFNTDIAGDISAAIVNVAGGTLDTKSYLAVDLDGSGTFTGTDFVIEITGDTGAGLLSTANFI